MNKKRIAFIVVAALMLVSTIIGCWAIFHKETQLSTNLSYFDFDINSTLFSSTQDANLSFSAPGEKKDITLNTSNKTDLPLSYYFGIEIDGNSSGLEDALLVYYDDNFLGTLSSLCRDKEMGLEYIIKDSDFILPKEDSVKNILRLELHNASSESVYATKKVSIKINLYVKTVDVRSHIFVKDFSQLEQAVSQINQGEFANRTIVFADNIALQNNLNITKPCQFDLLGKTIDFNNNKITFEHDGTSSLDSSRKTSYKSSVGGILLNHPQGYLNINESVKEYSDNTTVVNCDTAKAQREISQRILEKTQNGILYNQSVDIFSGLNFYVSNKVINIETQPTDYEYLNGVITPDQIIQTTRTSSIKVNSIKNEFKIIGQQDSLFQKLIDEELKHLTTIKGDISYNLFLPTRIKKYNASIEWWSSDTSIMKTNGICPDKADGIVTVVATIKINNRVFVKEFTFSVVKMNNDMRFQYLLSKIGNIVLEDVGEAGAKLLPTSDNYTSIFGIQDLEISEMNCILDPKYYYITQLVSQTDNKIFLNQVTFETFAQVNISLKFKSENAQDKPHVGSIGVEIKQGNNEQLIKKVYDYVRGEFTKVNVWQNIVNSRQSNGVNNENGDFTMPSEYMGFAINYSITDDSGIASNINDPYTFNINFDYLKESAYEVPVKVTVSGGSSQGSTMGFIVPAAIHNNTAGFEDATTFNSTRSQVYTSVGYANTINSKNYIFVNDIQNCLSLTYDASSGDFTKSTAGIKYFENLKSISIDGVNAQAFSKDLSKLSKIETVIMTNASLTDIKPLSNFSLLKKLDISYNPLITDISPILNLNLAHLKTLNVYKTGIDMKYTQCHFDYGYTSYYKNNNQTFPDYYYTHTDNTIKRYEMGSYDPDYLSAVNYSYMLNEIVEVSSNYMQLPSRIVSSDSSSILVTWGVINTQGEKLRMIENPLRLEKVTTGNTIVSAKITVNTAEFTRYFYVNVK